MKQLVVCATVLSLLSFAACNQKRVRGSGHVTTETRTIGEFSKLAVAGDMDVYFTQGPEKEAIVEAEDNIQPYIELQEKGDELIVRIKDHISLKSHKGIKITLTAPHVSDIVLSGSGNIKLVNRFENDGPVKFKIAGSGNIEGTVNSPSVEAVSAGSGDIKLSGETRDLKINLAGSGDFEGEDLYTESTRVNTAGSGNAFVHASVKLDVNIVGSGDVTYKGNPSVESHTAGSGSVRKAN